jgi:hypothetical protein
MGNFGTKIAEARSTLVNVPTSERFRCWPGMADARGYDRRRQFLPVTAEWRAL